MRPRCAAVCRRLGGAPLPPPTGSKFLWGCRARVSLTALAREIEGFRVLASSLLRDPGAHIAAPSSSSLYRELGKAWQASVGVVEALSGDEVHVPEEGHSVEEDVLDALVTATQEVWASVKPKINGVTVPQRISSITKAYRLFRAAASAAPGGRCTSPGCKGK